MSLTTAQLATLKTDIQGQGSLATAVSKADWPTVAAFYNAAGTTPVWRSDIKSSEIVSAVVGSEYVALTAQKQQGLTFVMAPGIVDATSANVRADFSAIFSAGTTLNALTALAQRTGTRLEFLLSDQGNPATSQVYGYTLTANDVQKAMGF